MLRFSGETSDTIPLEVLCLPSPPFTRPGESLGIPTTRITACSSCCSREEGAAQQREAREQRAHTQSCTLIKLRSWFNNHCDNVIIFVINKCISCKVYLEV